MRCIPRRLLRVPAAALALLAAPLAAAVPGTVNFQGLLLDDQGDPVTGPVDLVLRLYDAEESGTLLWTESHADVDVLDGVYAVELGASTPLTPEILDAPALYLEVEVEGDTLAPRQRLLAVPYALRARTAETADSAASVDMLPSGFVTELIEHVNLDGGGPENLDPREGLADVDGDGVANFVDPDNDGDGLSDITEVAQGSDINLVTPRITGFVPPSADGFVTTSVEVQGLSFLAGLTVAFGSETPTPTSVTPTSFQVEVGPQPEGTVSVVVTNPGGETATTSFDFTLVQPVVTSLTPVSGNPGATTTVSVAGTGFEPGVSVSFGTLTPTPYNVTSTSFQVDVGPHPGGEAVVPVTVTNLNGKQDADSLFAFLDETRRVFVTSTQQAGNLGGIAGADAICTAAAASAGLPGQPYRAWLGDGSADPASRFPQDVGPYELLDGTRIADDWTDLTDGTLDAPIDRDESDTLVTSGLTAWTGVAADGSSLPDRCSGWTSSSGAQVGQLGQLDQTGAAWTADGTAACSTPQRLYCFQGEDDRRTVFVAPTVIGSNLGSIAQADVVCGVQATAAGLPGTFRAWISDGVTDPASRLSQDGRPFVKLGEETVAGFVADDWADLTDGSIDAPIDRTAFGLLAVGTPQVWTGVATDGTSLPGGSENCDGWTNPSQLGRTGRMNETDADWTADGTALCSTGARLYCVEE